MYSLKHWTRISIYIIALTFVQAFVFNTILDLLFADTLWLLVFAISALIALGSGYIYFVGTLVQNEKLDNIHRGVGLWWGLLFNLFVGSVFYWIIILFTGSVLYGSIPILLSLVGFIFGIKRARHITTKELTIEIDDLPESWHEQKFVFVSDFHLGKTLRRDFLENVVDKINLIEAKMILIGGDLFDSSHADWAHILQPFKKLNLKDDVYYVTGNHEHHINYHDDLRPHLEELKFNILDSKKVEKDGLTISGIFHSLSKEGFDFKAEFDSLEINYHETNVFLYHSPTPAHAQHALDNGINLQLSGHSHFGQLLPYNVLTWMLYGHFDYGLYFDKLNQAYQYTSSGVGTWGPPIRTTARPEVVAITLKKNKY